MAATGIVRLFDEDRARITAESERAGSALRLDGPPVRTLHVNLDEAMKADSDQQADLIRISENSCSGFPEPTVESLPDRRRFEVAVHCPRTGLQLSPRH